jgi:hypothetical protein
MIEPGAGDEKDDQSCSATLRAQAHEADEHEADAMQGVVGDMALRARCLLDCLTVCSSKPAFAKMPQALICH